MNKLEHFSLPPTQKTPEIKCDATTGLIKISGNCVPEDAVDFFTPVKNWLTLHSESPTKVTKIDVELHYFNTSTSRVLLNLFRLAKTHEDKGKLVNVDWYYEDGDEDIKEAGEDFQTILGDFIKVLSY